MPSNSASQTWLRLSLMEIKTHSDSSGMDEAWKATFLIDSLLQGCPQSISSPIKWSIKPCFESKPGGALTSLEEKLSSVIIFNVGIASLPLGSKAEKSCLPHTPWESEKGAKVRKSWLRKAHILSH